MPETNPLLRFVPQGLPSAPPTVDDEEERRFREWYAAIAKQRGLDPNPDDPRHHYDYRAAFRAGAKPDEATGHWPSQFKSADHPRRFLEINGKLTDTRTGEAVAPTGRNPLLRFLPPQPPAPIAQPASSPRAPVAAAPRPAPPAAAAPPPAPPGLGDLAQAMLGSGMGLAGPGTMPQKASGPDVGGLARSAGKMVLNATAPVVSTAEALLTPTEGTTPASELRREQLKGYEPLRRAVAAAGKKLALARTALELGDVAMSPEHAGRDFFENLKKDPVNTLAQAGLENMGSLLSTLGAAYVGGGPLALAVGFTQEAGSAYEEAKKEGATESRAQTAAATTGLVNMWLERIFPESVVKGAGVPKAARASILRRVVEGTLKEGATESLQELDGQLSALATYAGDEGLTWKDLRSAFSPENLERYGAAGVMGAFLSAGTTVAAAPVELRREGAPPAPPSAAQPPVEPAARPQAAPEPPAQAASGFQEPRSGPVPSERPAEPEVRLAPPQPAPAVESTSPPPPAPGLAAGPTPAAAAAVTEDAPRAAPAPSWGEPWSRWRTDDGRPAEMRRKGQHVRFFDTTTGEQIGPEQSNVAPAFAAATKAGWRQLVDAAPVAVSPPQVTSEAEDLTERTPEPEALGSLGGNILGPLFGNQRAALPEPATSVTAARHEVEQRFQAAKGIRSPGIFARAREAASQALVEFQRTDPEINPRESPQMARVADTLRLHRAAAPAATTRAVDIVDEVTRGLSPKQGDLFTRKLVLPDILKDAEAGLYEGRELPFGYKDAAEVSADAARFQAEADKPENKAVVDAIAAREKVAKDLVAELVAAELLPAETVADPRYYHRQVLSHMSGQPTGPAAGVRLQRKGFQKQRTGGGDFNTDYQQAEFEWISDALELLAKKKTLDRLRTDADIGPRLRAEAEAKLGSAKRWRELVPADHVVWQPQKGNHFYPALTITERALDQVLAGERELAPEDVREAFAMGGPKEQWVIPGNLARALERIGRGQSDGALDGLLAAAQSSWKQWKLLNPLRFIKYNLNNLSGDLDIAMAVAPRMLRLAPQAANELWAYHVQRKAPAKLQEEFHRLQELAVLDGGLTVEEIPDVSREGLLRPLYDRRPGVAAQAVEKYWGGVKTFTVWRENTLRLAAYRYFRQEIAAGRKPYGASNRNEVDAITDPEERAAKLAREAIGDYGAVSHAGRYIRRHLIPFYSWMEINAPRYVRLLQNAAATEGGGGAARVAGTATLAVARRAPLELGKLALRANALYLLMAAWNRALFPDEEDDLRENSREHHLIYGRDRDTGEVKYIRFEGALADALEWFNLADWAADLADLRAGRKSLADVGAEAVKAPAERIAQALGPFPRTLLEAAAGKSAFPRLFERGTSFKPSLRQIQDRGAFLADVFDVEPLYTAATKKPVHGGRGLPGRLLERMAPVYRVDPGETSYWEIRERVGRFLRERDKGSSGGFEKNDRQAALYFWKKAVRYRDTKAASYWLHRYGELGGTEDGIGKSLKMGAPLGSLSKKDREDFTAGLTPEERRVLERAERWYGLFFGEEAVRAAAAELADDDEEEGSDN